MKNVKSSSSRKESVSAKGSLIQVVIQKWVIEEAGLPFSALTVEKSGDEWVLSIPLDSYRHSKKLVRFPAVDILINGVSLDRYLKAMETQGILP